MMQSDKATNRDAGLSIKELRKVDTIPTHLGRYLVNM